MKGSILSRVELSNWRRLAGWGLGAILLIIVAFYGSRAVFSDSNAPVRLVVYAFSTQEEVLTQSILPAFEAAWEAETGRDLTIEAVFGPSGTLAGQINLGAPADVALLSNEQHVNWLKIGRRVERQSQPWVISATPMVIVTRPGNPAGIADFADLAQPGLRLLHADPRSSGAGDWAVLAEYGSALLETRNPEAAAEQLKAISGNVRLVAPSARATLTLFELGAGDAMITYEQDARLAMARGVPLEIVIPRRTILAYHVAVLVDANLTPPERPVARAFISYLLSEAGQQALCSYHLRPADLESADFPALAQPFTVDELGGWSSAYSELVENLWQTQVEPRLDLEAPPGLLDTRGE
jgi:ABC-type sulfate transport system substrate-binding protein